MKNKINWYSLIGSILVSIVFGIGYTLLWPRSMESFLGEWIMNSLSFSALPGLYIACLVILSVKDVQEKLEYLSVLNDFEKDAKAYFYQNYNKDDGFKGQYALLNCELELFIMNRVGENSESVLERLILSSRECEKFIEEFKYVDAFIKNIESSKNNEEQKNEFNLQKKGNFIDFNSKEKDDIINLLHKLYSERKILDHSELITLSKLLRKYNIVCRVLHEKIDSELQLKPLNQNETVKEEVRIDE